MIRILIVVGCFIVENTRRGAKNGMTESNSFHLWRRSHFITIMELCANNNPFCISDAGRFFAYRMKAALKRISF